MDKLKRLLDGIDFERVRDDLRDQKPMQFVPSLDVAASGLDKYGFSTLREFVTAHTADGGLGIPLDKARWLIEFNPAYKHQAKELIALLGIAALAEAVPVLNENGVKGTPSDSGNRIAVKGGENSRYRIAKLKRDHPEIAARLAQGEFSTVAEAERAAGVKAPLRPKARLTVPLDDREEAVRIFEGWLAENYDQSA